MKMFIKCSNYVRDQFVKLLRQNLVAWVALRIVVGNQSCTDFLVQKPGS